MKCSCPHVALTLSLPVNFADIAKQCDLKSMHQTDTCEVPARNFVCLQYQDFSVHSRFKRGNLTVRFQSEYFYANTCVLFSGMPSNIGQFKDQPALVE